MYVLKNGSDYMTSGMTWVGSQKLAHRFRYKGAASVASLFFLPLTVRVVKLVKKDDSSLPF